MTLPYFGLTLPKNRLAALKATNFDGSTQYGSGGSPTGIADGKAGTVSFWYVSDQTTAAFVFHTTGPRFFVEAGGTARVQARNAAGTVILDVTDNGGSRPAGTIMHVVASWDLATTTAQLYVNDVKNHAGGATITNDTIDYTVATWAIAATAAGAASYDGRLSEVFFHTTHIDLDTATNRRKFISADLRPVEYGANGSTPLGVQPLIYLPNGDPADNKGSGGNFTVTGGPLPTFAGPGT